MQFKVTVSILEKTGWVTEWSYNVRQQGSKLKGNNHTFNIHDSVIKFKEIQFIVVTRNLVGQFRSDQILHDHVVTSFFGLF